MSKITSQIWIGPFSKASDEKFLKRHKITHSICCAKEFNAPTFLSSASEDEVRKRWVSLPITDDKSDAKTKGYFKKGAGVLNKWITAGHKVIVHCYGGISRSVSTVLAYLMIYSDFSYDQAYDLVKKGRPELNPHPLYVKILKGMEKCKTRKRRRD